MPRCAGEKRDGTRCTAIVKPPNEYCYQHDPANAEQRKKAASKGGRAKGGKELRAVKGQLQDITNAVLKDLDPRRGAVAVQALSAMLRAVEVGRKIEEQEELVERIQRLEEAAQNGGGSRAWRT